MRKSITMVDNLSRYLNENEERVIEILRIIENLEKENNLVYSKDLSRIISEHFAVSGYQGQLQGMAYFYKDWIKKKFIQRKDLPGSKIYFSLGKAGKEKLFKSLAN